MISFQDAVKIVSSLAHSFGTEAIHLDDAAGRVLAENVSADRDYPPFNRCSMDGYAIRVEDFDEGARIFEISETIFAGQISKIPLQKNQCYKIMTGAAVPLSANAVIRREDTFESAGKVEIKAETCLIFQNIALKGQDITENTPILKMGDRCTAPIISLLATLGKEYVIVNKLPTIAVFTTGDEVIEVGKPVSEVQIRNSNGHLLQALLKERGLNQKLYKHVADNKEDLKKAFTEALDYDLIITSGGVSAGDADFLPEVFDELNIKKEFHKTAIKPGKPIWVGKMPNGGTVFALPGNPFSTLVTFHLFVDLFLKSSAGLSQQNHQKSFHGVRNKLTNLDEFFPVNINEEDNSLEPVQINGSGDIRLGLNADAIAHHPAEIATIKWGSKLSYYLLK
ncbi:MAG: molybdopterin molybdenumtransferase MoeA [Daejeonella sp.]|nr:molybdopterin molybdenumtransferase MoeA [Daejeonella sp.]